MRAAYARSRIVERVLIRDGKIARWREYQYRSDLDFETFAGLSGF
jgi:hypothetical protein